MQKILANIEIIVNLEKKSHIVFCLQPLRVLVQPCEFLGMMYPAERPQYMHSTTFCDASASDRKQTHQGSSNA